MQDSPQPWLFLAASDGDPAWNMALDEAILRGAPQVGRPVLRFYGWTVPAATFGYFQKISDIERATPLRPLLRRPTGGGLVPHDADWTYSVVIPPTHPWYHWPAAESYAHLHRWLQAALQRLGVATELAPAPRHELPGQCFAGYERHDLLRHGRKIAGAAQRRTREGLLIQGSLQPPPRHLTREQWAEAMRAHAAEAWAAVWVPWTPPDWLLNHAQKLAETKYGRPEYNARR